MTWFIGMSDADISTQTLAYTVDSSHEARITVEFTNRSTSATATATLWVVPSGEGVANEHLKESGTTLGLAGTPQAVLVRRVIAPAGAKVYVQASTANVSCQLSGDVVSPDNTESALTTAIAAVTDLIPTLLDVSKTPYNAAVDGTTDDSAAIQAAIDAANTAGFGTVYIPGICAIGTKINLKRNVCMQFASGAYLKWIGSASGTCVETLSTDVVQNCQWYGLTIDTGAAFTGTALKIHSAHNIYADVIRFVSTGTASKCMTMYADSSAGESSLTKRNTTAVNIGAIIQQGECGTLLETGGVDTASGYDGNAQVVTLNTINSIFAEKCWVYGINIIDWTDNNNFIGNIRLAVYGNNAVAVACPSGVSASDNLGVYANQFGTIAADTFSTYTGRIGLYLGRGKLTKVGMLYNNPVAEGGAFVADLTATSYDVAYHRDSDGQVINYRRLSFQSGDGFTSSEIITLADDTATSIDMNTESSDQNICFAVQLTSDSANGNGIAWCKCRRSGGTAEVAKWTGDAFFAVTTGVLAGTTGTDVRVTVSPANDGKLYIENRIGASIRLRVMISNLMQVS